MKAIWGSVLVGILVLGAGFLALSCKGKSNPAGPGGGGAADFTVNIRGFSGGTSYSPDTITVALGQTIAWHNSDAISHTATGDGVPLFDTGTVASGATSAAIHMNTSGTHTYHCTIHGLGMFGAVIVTP